MDLSLTLSSRVPRIIFIVQNILHYCCIGRLMRYSTGINFRLQNWTFKEVVKNIKRGSLDFIHFILLFYYYCFVQSTLNNWHITRPVLLPYYRTPCSSAEIKNTMHYCYITEHPPLFVNYRTPCIIALLQNTLHYCYITEHPVSMLNYRTPCIIAYRTPCTSTILCTEHPLL